jgi:hypothetical protein
MNEEEKAERRRAWHWELRGGKGSIWEGGSITPFYIQWEGKIGAGMEYNQLSGVIDIFPTILDISGIGIPENNLPVHGRSFWPVLQGKTPPDWENRRYFDNTNFYLIQRHEIDTQKPQMHHIALHYQDYKLIRVNNALYGGPDSVYYLLYDLAADPVEKNDILNETPEIEAQLIPEIESWYKDVLDGGRAFHQAVYEIGNREETITPINLDAVLELKGSVKRSENSTFRYDNWITTGSAMLFEIDVKEEGNYQVELGYSCDPSRLGSVFKAYTRYDTAIIRIDHPSSALSDTLLFPPGRQVLHVELVSLGQGDTGVDVMNHILVHRIPGKEETNILSNTGMKVFTGDDNQRTFHFSSATADFMFGNRQENPLEVLLGEEVTILPFADNEDQIQQVELFLGFDRIETITKPPFSFSLTPENPGRFTINVEFTSVTGITHSVYGDIIVK